MFSGQALQPLITEYLATAWRQPGESIWEVRGGWQHFVHSKVMVWVAFDRAPIAIEGEGLKDPARR
jgi:GH15 family glucan-1,4-alpha-glucosidase